MISEPQERIEVSPVCTHANAVPVTTYRETASGNVEMTKEIVCRDCGDKVWFLTSQGATQKIIVPMTWDGNVAMQATHTARSNGAAHTNGTKKKRPTAEQVIEGMRRKLGEGPGTELAVLNWQRGLVMSCQACDDLAKRMNEWGADGCHERFDEIVDDILPRATRWVSDNRPAAIKMFIDESRWPQPIKDWLSGKREALESATNAAKKLVDVETPMIRGKVGALVTEALDNWLSRAATLKGD